MKPRHIITLALLSLIAYSALSSPRRTAFPLAENFPRGALIYAETDDLSSLLEYWSGSGLGEKYMATTNFQQLKDRHLGLKLASRWQEFSDAAGFQFDIAAITGFADKHAAVAVYDIGKLDFVFLAPMSAELFAATAFARAGRNFSNEEYEGESILRVRIEADRGRQRQDLIVAHLRGHLIIVTSEVLFVRVVSNLKRSSKNDRLSQQPAFSRLSSAIAPAVAAIWLDQAKLNDDYYFKRYFLSPEKKQVETLISAAATIGFESGQVVEQRVFFTNDSGKAPRLLSKPESLLRYVPAPTDYYKVESIDAKGAADAVTRVILGSVNDQKQTQPRKVGLSYPADEYHDYQDRSYEASISDDDMVEPEMNPVSSTDLMADLEPASPTALAAFAAADSSANPIFPEFRRGIVLQLGSSLSFDTRQFERSVAAMVKARTIVHYGNDGNAEFNWESEKSCGLTLRVLKMPLLGREIAYALSGSNLIFANDQRWLCESLSAGQEYKDRTELEPINEISVVDLRSTREAYLDIFSRLSTGDPSADLFAGNIGGLINVLNLSKIERKRWLANGLECETITVTLE